MNLPKILLEHKKRPRLPPLLLASRSQASLRDLGVSLKAIPESPVEETDEVEVKMSNKRLVLVNGGVRYSLSEYVERQFQKGTRSCLLEPIEKGWGRKRGKEWGKASPRSRIRVV